MVANGRVRKFGLGGRYIGQQERFSANLVDISANLSHTPKHE